MFARPHRGSKFLASRGRRPLFPPGNRGAVATRSPILLVALLYLLVFLSCVPATIAWGLEAASQEMHSLPTDVLRQRFSCGPNSLYLFLQLHGQKVTLDEVNQVVHPGMKGVSLLQLKEAAAKFGLQTRIHHCTWDDLVRCPKPTIAYLHHLNEAVAGHYVVVLDADREKNVDFIDGSDGVLYRNRHGFFTQGWTGYLLIPPAHSEPQWDIVFTSSFWLGLGLMVWVIGPTARSMTPLLQLVGRYHFRVWLVVCGLVLLPYPGEARHTQPSLADSPTDTSTASWRTRENDGLTCLYVLLALDGHTANYADLWKEITAKRTVQNPSGMVALRQVAQHHGLNLDIRKCGIKELTAEHLPMIALTEQAQETGSFVLVLWFESDKCGIVDGYGRYKQVAVDDFRRRFTGHVLVRQSPSRLWLVLAAIGWTFLIVYGGWRIRPTWHLLRNSQLEIYSPKER